MTEKTFKVKDLIVRIVAYRNNEIVMVPEKNIPDIAETFFNISRL